MHGFHFVVIGDDLDKITKTIYSVIDHIPYWRSLTIASYNSKKIYFPFKIDTKQTNIKINNGKKEGIIDLFEQLTILKKFKIFLLFQDEMLLSQHKYFNWNKYTDNVLIRLYHRSNTKNYYWSPRVLNLRDNWIINDFFYPKLQDKSISISLLDAPIYIMNSNVEFPQSNINQTFKKSLEFVNKGEINLAKKYFILTKNQTINNNIKSVCFFGIAYCLIILGAKYSKVNGLLVNAYLLSNRKSLEPIALLLHLALKEKNYQNIVDLINKYPDIKNDKEIPITTFYNVKPSLYKYLLKYYLIYILYKSKNYHLLIEILDKYVNNKEIPIKYRLKSILIYKNIKKILKDNLELKENFSSKKDIIHPKIQIILKKINPINVNIINLDNSPSKLLFYNIGNKKYQKNNEVYHLNYNQRDISIKIHIKNNLTSLLTVLKDNEEIVCGLPILFPSFDYEINSIGLMINKQLIFGTINCNIGGLPKLELNNLSLKKYKYIIYESNNSVNDYYEIIFILLNGCFIFYRGDQDIYNNLKHKYGKFIINITSWTLVKLKNILSYYRDVSVNTREISNSVKDMLFFNLIHKLLNPIDHSDKFSIIATLPSVKIKMKNNQVVIDEKMSLSQIIDKIENTYHYIYKFNLIKDKWIYIQLNKKPGTDIDTVVKIIEKNKHVNILLLKNSQLSDINTQSKSILMSDYWLLKECTFFDSDIIVIQDISFLYTLSGCIKNNKYDCLKCFTI